MGSELKPVDWESKSAFVKSIDGIGCWNFATEEIDINASMGSDVRYSGNPTVRHTNKNMGSDIGKIKIIGSQFNPGIISTNISMGGARA